MPTEQLEFRLPLTDDFSTTLRSSESAARARGGILKPEYLLLGLAYTPAPTVLDRLSAPTRNQRFSTTVSNAINFLTRKDTATSGESDVTLDSKSRSILHKSQALAETYSHPALHPGHLLAAILSTPDNMAFGILHFSKVTIYDLQQPQTFKYVFAEFEAYPKPEV